MKYFLFRNYTIEPFFKGFNAEFSGYEDISIIDKTADTYIWFYLMPHKPNNEITAKEIENYCEMLDLVSKNIGADKDFIIFTMSPLYKINYIASDTVLENAIAKYNEKIYSMSAKVIDFGDFVARFSGEELVDWKYYFLSQMPLNPKLALQFGKWFSRQLEIIQMKRKKCLVLDLDNTLWHGILGEDEIKMGEDYPGNAYRFFQNYLLELSKKGIILTICSKNNEKDVMNILENHPDMILKKDVFSAMKINWNNKADNIREIAEELNIGLDCIVFIDDNPAERELVKQTFSEITVPEFPAQPYLYPIFIKQLTDNYFSAYTLTNEDLVKTQQYKENAERVQYKAQFVDMDSYLRGLEIELTIEPLNEFNKARFAQLTQKTNQFNLTTKRYTEAQIQSFADNGDLVFGLRVKDKFGDYGISGLVIVLITGEKAHIDTFLLSCRVLGKGIEQSFVKKLLKKLPEKGVKTITAEYIKSEKNEQVEKFYETVEFAEWRENERKSEASNARSIRFIRNI